MAPELTKLSDVTEHPMYDGYAAVHGEGIVTRLVVPAGEGEAGDGYEGISGRWHTVADANRLPGPPAKTREERLEEARLLAVMAEATDDQWERIKAAGFGREP